MTPLLPCPFCGKSNAKPFSYLKLHVEAEPDNFVQCQECGTMGPGGNTPPFNDESAIREWNTRAPEVARDKQEGGLTYSKCHSCGDEYVTMEQARDHDDIIMKLRAELARDKQDAARLSAALELVWSIHIRKQTHLGYERWSGFEQGCIACICALALGKAMDPSPTADEFKAKIAALSPPNEAAD